MSTDQFFLPAHKPSDVPVQLESSEYHGRTRIIKSIGLDVLIKSPLITPHNNDPSLLWQALFNILTLSLSLSLSLILIMSSLSLHYFVYPAVYLQDNPPSHVYTSILTFMQSLIHSGKLSDLAFVAWLDHAKVLNYPFPKKSKSKFSNVKVIYLYICIFFSSEIHKIISECPNPYSSCKWVDYPFPVYLFQNKQWIFLIMKSKMLRWEFRCYNVVLHDPASWLWTHQYLYLLIFFGSRPLHKNDKIKLSLS